MTNYGTESPCLLGVPEVKFVKPNKGRQSKETNELLNNTDVKMRDFDSIDSDDFLDDENEACSTGKCACVKQRTSIEKVFFVLLIIAVCVIIGLLVRSSNKSNDTASDSICQSKGCVDVANQLLSSLDKTVKPCDDFYKYACGGWEKETPIPAGYSYWDRTQELAHKNMFQLHQLLESYNSKDDAISKAKKFHDSCMNEASVSQTAVIQKFQKLIELIRTGQTEHNFTFVVILENIHRLNSWPLFTVSMGPDEQTEDTDVLKISHSDVSYPMDVLIDEDDNSSSKRPTQTYLQWDAIEVKKRYLGDASKILKLFWNKTDEEADRIAGSILHLEIEIAKTRGKKDYLYNRVGVYNKTTVDVLQQKCGMLEWESYLTGLTYGTTSIKNDETIVLLHQDSLQKLCDVVSFYQSNNENKTVLYYYLLVHAARSFMPYFDVSSFTDVSKQKELEFDGDLWRRCTFYTNKAFGFATTALYINGTGQHDNVAQIEQLVQDVKDAFKEFVFRKVWFRGDIRNRASKKIDQMLQKVSYPSEILNKNFLNEFYTKIEVGNEWFTNLQNWKKFEVSSMFKDHGKKTDRQSWIKPPFTVESDYDPVRNELNFPTAMLHIPFYTADGPQTFNYGALAAMIGHEITHGFDIVGRQYNDRGKLEEWWDPLTVSSFNKTATCMKEQYDEYKIDGFSINGLQTLDENIADNGGLRAAFFAYQMWERKGLPEKKLPGVDLDNRQLFFISYAQMFCSKWKPDGLQKYIIDDTHSPGPIRVRGAVSNMNTFEDAFNCPFISNYSPNSKCEVW